MTKEGDVLLTLEDKTVWVSEGFDLAMARKLREQVDAANVPAGSGPMMTASNAGNRKEEVRGNEGDTELMGGLVRAIGSFGMMKVGLR
jgi:hypothetical protein